MSSNRRLLIGLLLCLTTLGVLSTSAMARETHVVSSVFGSHGAQAGQLSEPRGIAVNPVTHDVYVADTGNARVDQFSAAGVFVRAWGWGVADGFSQLETCTLSCEAGASGGGAGQFTRPSSIAIDTSTGPSAGDVYVGDPGDGRVSKFDAEGNPVGSWGEGGQLSGSSAPAIPFGEVAGVAVASNGNLLVINTSKIVFEFTQAGAFITSFEVARETVEDGLGVDGSGHIFKVNGALNVQEFTSSGENLGQVNQHEHTTGMGVDSATGDLYADVGSEIERFAFAGTAEVHEADGSTCHFESSSGCAPTEAFGGGVLTGAGTIGIDPSSGEVYVAEPTTGEIIAFTPIVQPDIALGNPSVVTHAPNSADSSVTLSGSVNPDDVPVSSCQFEYGAEAGAYTKVLPCTPAPGAGDTPVSVSAQLNGLAPGTYYFDLVAGNSYGTVASHEKSFVVPGPPIISEESFSDVGSNSAVVSALIDADGASTSFVIEYGTTSSYGSVTPVVSAGLADESVQLTSHLTGLQPGTPYHFRLRLTNEFATIQGADDVFSTLPEAQSGLPDGRGYELVTPVNGEDAQVYAPEGSGSLAFGEGAARTFLPVRAAQDGHAVVYVGEPTAEGNGNQGQGNDYLATRGPNGWTAKDMQPTGFFSPKFLSFSDDLSEGVFDAFEPLTPGAPDYPYNDLYVRGEDGSLGALISGNPPHGGPQELAFAGGSRDFKHLFFEADDALTATAVDGGQGEGNLYESFDGKLRLVNVLPDGSTEPSAFLGAPSTGNGASGNTEHAISADGSRAFWTDVNTGALYVRENGATTVLIAEHATFWTASEDGLRVLYAKNGDLYEGDLATEVTTDLTPSGEVLGIAGASEDASYVYFVADGVLAPGAVAGQPNLYLHHGGTTTLIAALASEAEEDSGGELYGFRAISDWRPALGDRTAEATPDGHALTFMSARSLTGYDNRNRDGQPLFEVYVYDAVSGKLSCASCSPSGERPTSGRLAAGYLPTSEEASTYQFRLISEDGGRVFFQSTLALVPQDVNGKDDVYEWESDGTGSCRLSSGCIYLLSDGAGKNPSFLLDASASGADVFIVTSAQLVRQDENEIYDVYDVRIGVEAPPSPPECTGTGCQGLPGAPPIFATPSSVTYNGVGNFAPSAKVATKKKQTKTKKKKQKAERGRGAKKRPHQKRRRSKTSSRATKAGVITGTNWKGGR